MRRLEACDARILDAYEDLKNSAQRMGDDTVEAASATNKKRLLTAAILLIVGILCFFGPWYAGILLIECAGYLFCRQLEPAKHLLDEVDEMNSGLRSALNRSRDK